jgi:hypothetical protein
MKENTLPGEIQKTLQAVEGARGDGRSIAGMCL